MTKYIPQRLRSAMFLRRVIINIMIGLVIGVGLHLVQDKPLVTRVENTAMDLLIRLQQRLIQVPENAVPFVFIDIDEQTHRNWGNPYFVPRDHLAKLLDFSMSGKPAMVLVDIAVDERDASSPEERKAISVLTESLKLKSQVKNSETTVLFVASSQPSLEKRGKRELRPSFLDTVIEEHPQYLKFSPLFYRDQYDQTIRRWKLYEDVCKEPVPVVISSAQLLAITLMNENAAGVNRLNKVLSKLGPALCGGEKMPEQVEFSVGGKVIDLLGDRLSNRIIYSVPWDHNKQTIRTTDRVNVGGRQVDLVTHIPAALITDSVGLVESTILDDRVVVIGATFEDGRDWHMTPIGYMPGATVLINAIHSLIQYGQMKRPPFWIILCLEMVMILLASVVFALLQSFLAKLLVGAVVLVVLIPATFHIFKYGIWLDFALPFVAIQFHETVAKWEHTLLGKSA